MSSSYTFNWPSGPKEVIVTGTFDNWGKTLPLVKQTDGSFELTVPFAKDKKVLYKYLVDGEWLTNPSQAVDKDENGIENNVLTVEKLAASDVKSKIPEAGGLSAAAGQVKTTVLPSSEGQQTTLGEPGIVIPQDKETLSAFTKFENTDRNLNEKTPEADAPVAALTPEEKKKQKKKLKRTKYKLNKKARANGENATSTSTESTPAPEEDLSKKNAIAGGIAGGIAATGAAAAATIGAHKDTAESSAKEAIGSAKADAEKSLDAPVAPEKEPAPYSLKEKDLDASTVVVPTDANSIAVPAVSAEKPEVKAPEVKTPEVKTPEVKTPEVKTPEVKTPEVKTPEVKAPEVGVPAVSAEKPDVKAPEVGVPAVSAEKPDVKAPEVKTPEVKAPEVKAPEVKAPEVKAPEVKTPEVGVPAVSAEKPDVKTPEVKAPVSLDAEKEAAPYALKEKDLAQSKIAPAEAKVTEESKNVESQNTLDSTVVGVVGAAAGASAVAGTAEAKTSKSADAVAAEISHEKSVEPTIKPAINAPIESPKDLSAPVDAEEPLIPSKAAPKYPAQLAPSSNIEDVTIAPVSNHAKEVTALPVNGEKLESEEEIIIAQGGHDPKAIEKQIIAAEDGPVSVEEIQPTVSEAKQLAEEAHIPLDEIKAEPVPVKHKKASSSSGKSDSGKTSSNGKSSKTDSKEKKKRGFFSKLKKIFK